jgi:uncharacterized UBP type Zn finger protein
MRTCTHLADLPASVEPLSTEGCPECIALGDWWVQLRMCLTCGNIACCDSSRNRHATKHFMATGHPVMRSQQPGQDWRWCYVDELLV